MKLTRYKLGELIEMSMLKNVDYDYSVEDVVGVNNKKKFIETKVDVSSRDLTKFQVIRKNEFVFNRRTSRNGSKFSIAFNEKTKSYICTVDYVVFKIREECKNRLLPTWLYLFFNRPEFDRYVIMNSWGSSTEFFNWDDMCDIDIDLPPIEIQQKYVDIYKGLLENQKSYETGLEDLKFTCDAYVDELKNKCNEVKVGNYIKLINNRNIENKPYMFKGLSMENYFIDSIANSTNLDFKKYKIVKPLEFGCVLMKVGRDARLTIARNDSKENYLISPAYYTFKLSNINSNYFRTIINRSEFERRAWFSCDTSARGSLPWEEFCDLSIPNASQEQQKIVSDLYSSYLIRKNINEKLKTQIKDICPILIKGSLEEARKG